MLTKAAKGMQFMMYQGGGANGLAPPVMANQWKALCRPVLEYGCEMWQGEISQQWCKRLEGVQAAFGRATLGVKTFPSSAAVRADLGLAHWLPDADALNCCTMANCARQRTAS
jgi:hypothetical protein